jgi:hypothetical protein
MIPVDQDRFHDASTGSRGNCVQACVASILGLSLADIPNFADAKDGPSQHLALESWMSDRGIELLLMPGNYVPDAFYLGIGPGPRGCYHMVVMRDGSLAHDPHPSRAGLLDVERVYLLLPKSIAEWKKCA